MTVSAVLDAAGRRRSPATFPEFHAGRPPRNKGQTYPADPPSVEEIVAILRACPDTLTGQRGRALMVLLWRTGLRISEALALREPDLEREREHSVFVRRGKGGKSPPRGRDGRLGMGRTRRGSSCARLAPRRHLLPRLWPGRRRGVQWASGRGQGDGPQGFDSRGRHPPSGAPARPSGTSTQWSSPAKGCRCTSSRGSSATPTPASQRSTCRASTPKRSSPPSTPGARPMMSATAGLRL